jgi:hypothetical protein
MSKIVISARDLKEAVASLLPFVDESMVQVSGKECR